MSLADDVRAILDGRPGTFGIYARNLTTDERVEVGADTVLPTESTAKTFILIHYCALVARGELDPSVRVTLSDDDRSYGSGVLRYLAAGLQPTLEDLAYLMVIISDNAATHLLLDHVGGAEIVNDAMAALGLKSARVNPEFRYGEFIADVPFGTSTPHDLAEAYTHLDDRARRILFRQQFQMWLPRRLPHTAMSADFGFDMPTRVYNKTGLGLGNCIDSGRFETDNAAWVVAAQATGQLDSASLPEDAAPSAFADIGELLHRAWADPPA